MYRPQKRHVPVGISKKKRRCLSGVCSWIQDTAKSTEPLQSSNKEGKKANIYAETAVLPNKITKCIDNDNRHQSSQFEGFLNTEFSKIERCDIDNFIHDNFGLEDSDNNGVFSSTTSDDRSDIDNFCMRKASSKRSMQELMTLHKWQNILAIVAVTGSVKFTVDQYNILRNAINWLLDRQSSTEEKLPSYSTVKRKLLPMLSEHYFVPSSSVLVDANKNKFRQDIIETETIEKVQLSYISPIDWAKRDILCPRLWKLFKESASDVTNRNEFPFKNIDRAPIVRNRSMFLRAVLGDYNSTHENEHILNNTSEQSKQLGHVEMEIKLKSVPQFPKGISEEFRNSLSIEECNHSARVVLKGIAKYYFVVGQNCNTVRREGPQTSIEEIEENNFISTERFMGRLSTQSEICWSVGDICCILALSPNKSCVGVLVFCHNLNNQSRSPMLMVWISRDLIKTGGNLGDGPFITYQEAIDLNTLRSCTNSAIYSQDYYNCCDAPTNGILDNGKPYFIYRILLYTDGFSENMSQTGSYTGCYFLPLNLPLEYRRSRGAVRLVALSPPGVSSNEVLKLVVDDLAIGATRGYNCLTADGEQITLFLDVVGTVADYPAITELLDVLGHTARSPCHLCSFRRRKRDDANESYYAICPDINSTHPSYMRSFQRTNALRSANLHEKQYRDLGMSYLREENVKKLALFIFEETLSRMASEVPVKKNDTGLIVCKALFDPYRSTFIGADHLLHGITISLLTIGFKLLPSLSSRHTVETWISKGLSVNGLQKQRNIFNYQKGSLHHMTITQSFSLLLIADAVFNDIKSYNPRLPDSYRQLCKLLKDFRKLVGITYWMPSVEVEGHFYITNIWDDDGFSYLSALKRAAYDFTKNCHTFISKFPQVGYILDKPNLHRIMELYNHSIPAFGHVSHFAELVYESAHQPLKRAIKRSNHINPHLQATSHYLADEWFDRLQTTIGTSEGLYILTRFILKGSSCVEVSDDQKSELHVTKSLLEHIHATSNKSGDLVRFDGKWIAFGLLDIRSCESQIQQALCEDVIKEQTGAFFCNTYKYAKYCKNQFNDRAYGHYKIQIGSVIYCVKDFEREEMLEHNNETIDIETRFQSEQKFYVIHAIVECIIDIENAKKEVFALVRQCNFKKKKLWIKKTSEFTLVKLEKSIRKAAVMHCCSIYNCYAERTRSGCDANPLNGEKFRYFTKRDGFPPRQA